MSDSMFFVGKTLGEIRTMALDLGLNPAGLDKQDLCVKIKAKELEVNNLRAECISNGLDMSGSESDLRLRLEGVKPGALTKTDHILYSNAAVAMAVLGTAALLVSLPHLTLELSRISGLHWAWCALLAIVIDGGVIAAKVVDVLGNKFKLAKIGKINQYAMFVCLGFSSLVNASGFIAARGADVGFFGVVLSVVFAALISGFAWFGFTAASYLLTTKVKADEKPTQPQLTPSQKLRKAADEMERLAAIADRI